MTTIHEMSNGLYYHDSLLFHGNNNSDEVINYTIINTVAANKPKYTVREVTGADKATAFNEKTGYIRP